MIWEYQDRMKHDQNVHRSEALESEMKGEWGQANIKKYIHKNVLLIFVVVDLFVEMVENGLYKQLYTL